MSLLENPLVANILSHLLKQEKGQKLESTDGKIFLYALARRPLLIESHFATEKKDVEEKKTDKCEIHENLLYFTDGENERLC